MRRIISLIAGLTALFAMGPAGATDPDCGAPEASDTNPDTGHFFEIYAAARISWIDAQTCAAKNHPTIAGVTGHLATITSSKEDVWVDNLRRGWVNNLKVFDGLGEVWVGGSQTVTSATSADDEPGRGWRWENGEGSIATPQQPSPSYSNWLDGEPNNLGGSENHLAIGLDGSFGWNDEGNLNNITGYVVEYDIPRTAECTVDLDCETIKGQTLVFPEGSFEPNGDQTIGFTAFEFTDPRVAGGKCGIESLTLFRASDGFTPGVELRIPAYLCGSPRFVVVKVDATDLTIKDGAVEVVNDTEEVLPDNLFECTGPKVTDPLMPRDPQKQDVVVWQSTNPEEMLETSLSMGVFAGSATEATNGCGSTRAKVRTGSYFVVGMHIDFGDDFDYRDFVGLTLEKLKLLRESVSRARSAGVLKNGDATKMTAQLNNAVNKLDRGDPPGALKHVNQFLKFVAAARYNSELLPEGIKPYNYNGDHLMRGENIAFTLQDKVIPYRP